MFDAYTRLLLDVLRGSQAAFVRGKRVGFPRRRCFFRCVRTHASLLCRLFCCTFSHNVMFKHSVTCLYVGPSLFDIVLLGNRQTMNSGRRGRSSLRCCTRSRTRRSSRSRTSTAVAVLRSRTTSSRRSDSSTTPSTSGGTSTKRNEHSIVLAFDRILEYTCIF